jgi:hypothetical protein
MSYEAANGVRIGWSLNKQGWACTLFTVAYYPARGYFVAPQLPGLNKTIPVSSEEEGKIKAETLYKRYFDFLNGAEWYANWYLDM